MPIFNISFERDAFAVEPSLDGVTLSTVELGDFCKTAKTVGLLPEGVSGIIRVCVVAEAEGESNRADGRIKMFVETTLRMEASGPEDGYAINPPERLLGALADWAAGGRALELTGAWEITEVIELSQG